MALKKLTNKSFRLKTVFSLGYDQFGPNYYDRDRDQDRGYPTDRYNGGGSYFSNRDQQHQYNGYGVPSRPMFGQNYPSYEQPQNRPPPSGYDNSINSYAGDGFGGLGPVRPIGGSGTRCEGNDEFKQVGSRQRLRRQYVRRVVSVPSLTHCQRECVESRDFVCRSFNYKDSAVSYDTTDRERETTNCELSDRDSRELDLQNPMLFDGGTFDYYEKSSARSGVDDCLDVSQACNEDGMEFTLRTPEGFLGRIYTYGFYDRCFFRGNQGTVNVLRISGPQGYPECGTQRVCFSKRFYLSFFL